MKFVVAGLSYKTAGVDVREKVAVAPARTRCCGCRLKIGGGLREVVLLSTCNRVEIYGTTPWVNGNVHGILKHLGAGDVDYSEALYVKEGEDAVKHLFQVAGGLDSMVVGETEITGQLKNAYQTAKDHRLTGRVLNRLFQTALQVGKSIRTNTAVGRGAVSVGSVAVELTERIFDQGLSEKTVMIVGAGKMGEACVRHLAKKGARSVLVSNRSFERAQGLAAEFGGRAVGFGECFNAMREADSVVSSTGCPDTVIHRHEVEAVMRARPNRPLFLIDIAVPRDIADDVQQVENVYLYNIDHLEAIVRENLRSREHELAHCQEIIAAHSSECFSRLNPPPAGRPTGLKPQLNLSKPLPATRPELILQPV
jgi:glutamyl-tRNA reductase